MARIDRDEGRMRTGSAIAVAALHAVLGYALLAGFGVTVPADTGRALKLFDVAPPAPPPPVPPPKEKPAPVEAKAADREGAASPENLKARPSPVVAPPPRIRLDPPPTVTAATAPGEGVQAKAGSSPRRGEGSGGGGSGAGEGSGSSGSGSGGGGVAVGARLLSGRIADSDYPPTASRTGATGTVVAHLSVGNDGRVEGCRIARSSGSAELDEATCRLARQRFRYRPALDSEGRPVADIVGWKQTWWREAGHR